ncbi:MAG: tRNA preQ1(34) S-adenosylmethionine ribosyltransferase-isomerase QueA [Longimicrobiales bacterium]|nr:tRNA preQ1(34) S-adenosylmethionine ribosyltransferase-isomerase QueA [Longimicrobiales bacterium]
MTAGNGSDPTAPKPRIPDGTLVADYEYALPQGRIAQYPAERRDDARLLVLAADGSLRHRRMPDLVDLLEPGDALVVNESAVFPARLQGRKPTGADAEVLLVRPLPAWERAGDDRTEGRGSSASTGEARIWEALVRPGGKLKPGREVVVGSDLTVEILDSLESGSRVVRLVTDQPVEEALERHGRVPLPPYIERPVEAVDRERYQTVYARTPGSVAAPTAGLHFTEALLARVEALGVRRVAVTLHVGVGTFRPVDADDPAEHEMHREWYWVPPDTAEVLNRTRREGGRVWAVGTTAVRTLESAADEDGWLRAGSGETRLFIRPPYDFRVVDGLLTNFHLPRSTLLMLVAALAGYRRTMDAYRAAVAADYRFYSYGDAMVVEPPG